MNKLRYMIIALTAMLSFAAISCNQEEPYTPGEQDVEGCFGVYFPSQEASSNTITLDPNDRRRVKITVAREVSDVDYDVTVPVEISGDDIFEVEDIVFEGGAASTSFYVHFSDAEVGERYTCTIEVTDPAFVSSYRTKANYITFDVVVVSWDEIGEGTYLDYNFSNSQTGEPMTVKTKIYRNSNDKNLYRVDDPYTAFMQSMGALASTKAPEYFEFRVLQRGQEFIAFDGAPAVTIPIEDLVHYEPIFTAYADPSYGDAYLYHPCLLNGYEDPMTWYDNRVLSWKDSGKTMPGVVQLAPSLYFPAAGGYAPSISSLIVFPGAKLNDYTMNIVAGLSENGEVPVTVTIGEDVAKVKYAVFDGELGAAQLTEKTDGIIAGKIECKEFKTSGEYKIKDLKATGLYTLIAVAYDKNGNNVGHTNLVFGFLKAGETNPVSINCGLIVSDKYAPEGYDSKNSLEFYIYGSGIKKAHYGLYRKKDVEEKFESVMADLRSYSASEPELDAINGTGLTDVFIRLNSGMEYVLVVCASNGFEEKVVMAEAKLNGEINPLQMAYDLDMLTPAETRTEYCREWTFYAGTPDSNGRTEVGPLTITDGGTEILEIENEDGTKEDIEVEYLKVKGFWQPVIDAGYLKDDTMKWEYYGGAIVPLHGKVGSFKSGNGDNLNLEMISFFTSGNGGYADGALCGAFTEDGHIAFVDMETGVFEEWGSWWFTSLGVFDSKGNYQGDMIAYDEMMFIDEDKLSSKAAAQTSVQSQLQQVKANYQKNYNFVEYKRHQFHKAIDSVFGAVPSFGAKAGLDTGFERPQAGCIVEPVTDMSTGTLRYKGKPGSVSSRK
jgi:hypothetical protein